MQSKKLKLKTKKLNPQTGNSSPTSCKLPATICSGGFTLIETLVAIFIFSFSILGIIVITGNGVGDAQYAKNRLIASYLAQEGIELTRNIRDTQAIGGGGWNSFSALLVPCQSGCSANYPFWLNGLTNPFTACSTFEECLVYYDASTPSSYGYTQDPVNTTPTQFSRVITATPSPSSPDEIQITSEVSWKQGSGNTVYSVKAEESLFNWIL